MRLTKMRTPKEHEFEIYYAWMAHGLTQQQTAEKFEMTQGRVSQICSKIRRWVREVLPFNSNCDAQATFLAIDAHEERLRYWDLRARECLDLTCERMEGKPTRPDSRFIKEGVAISKERQEVAKAAVIAKAEMRTRRPRRGIAREDLLVHDAKMVCKSVLHGIKQLRKIGVVIAAPAYDPVEIERHVRTAFRKDPPVSETMSVRGLLPQAWTEASTQAFVLPLDGSPLPEPAPPSAPVAVVPKAKYRPECAPLTEADYAAIAAWDAAEAQCEAEQKAAAATCESANKEAVLGDENERTPLETPSERPLIPPRRKQPPSIFDGSPTGAEVAVARDPRLRWPARRTAQTNDHVQVNAAETPRESGDHHSAVIRLSTPIGPHGEWHLR